MLHSLFSGLVMLMLVGLCPPAAAIPTEPPIDWTDRDQVEREIEGVIGRAELGRFRGAVVIRVGGESVFARGYGLESRELHPIDPEVSLFDIGSVAKSVTAATVLRLIEEDKLSLSSTVGEVLGNGAGNLTEVTMEELLRHRSGLGSGGTAFSQPGALDSADGLIGALGQVPLGRKQFAYSNAGYFVLAAVIEKVGEGSFESITREMVFEPADLVGVGFVGDRQVPGKRPTARVSRATRGLPSITSMFDYPWNWGQRGATGVVMTAETAADWFEAIQAGDWLTDASRELMLAPSDDGYGLGLYLDVDEAGRVTRFWHGGSTGGFVCHIARYPLALDGQGATVVLMAESSIDLNGIARKIEQFISPTPPKPTFAGVYLIAYTDTDDNGVYSISGDLGWRGMPQYVGSDGTRRIVDARPTIILEDRASRMWTLILRLDDEKAGRLVEQLDSVNRQIASDPVGGQTPWRKGITFIADVRDLEVTEHQSYIIDDGAILTVRASSDHHVVLVVATPDGDHELARVRMGGAEVRGLQEQIRQAMQ